MGAVYGYAAPVPVKNKRDNHVKGDKGMAKRYLSILLAAVMLLGVLSLPAAAEGQKWTEEKTKDGWIRITQEGGATLGYYPDSGVTILEDGGFAFKDLNKNGVLDPYEDWRLAYEDRASDLVSKMSIAQMSGLRANGAIGSLADKTLEGFTDMNGVPMIPQIAEDGMRYYIMYPVAFGSELKKVVPTSNLLQQEAEASTLGIPMMLNCDPTTTMTGTVTSLALGATFDPEKVTKLSTDVAKLYRATGITMSLSPQVDLETDPRSQSVNTFTEDPALAAALTNAMVSAYQSTFDEEGNDVGWGRDSLAVQFKHFFGNLANEGGRNYHDYTGKYTVIPEDQVDIQLTPFIQGGFTLNSATGQASAVMVTYTVPTTGEGEGYAGIRGGAFNEFVMGKLEEHGFKGMISTDSLIFDTLDLGYMVMLQTAYNVDDLTMDEKILMMFRLGVDQIMGSVGAAELASAYNAFAAAEGQEAADENWKQAAYDCVLPIFRVGNFENPYVVSKESNEIFKTYTPDATNELAQSSIVMLKNSGIIKAAGEEKAKVYIASNGELPMSQKEIKKYFETVETAGEADFCIVFVDSPACINTGYDDAKGAWVPITLQYREYTADSEAVRKESLTGDPADAGKQNRSYYGASNTVSNEADLDLILETAKAGKPVAVCVNASGAFCVDEFEAAADAILVGFGVDKSNYLPLLAGAVEPSALLPLQMPANMAAVEAQASGVPRDMECYVDTAGNTYDFAFGLNWSGVIKDERVETYGK